MILIGSCKLNVILFLRLFLMLKDNRTGLKGLKSNDVERISNHRQQAFFKVILYEHMETVAPLVSIDFQDLNTRRSTSRPLSPQNGSDHHLLAEVDIRK